MNLYMQFGIIREIVMATAKQIVVSYSYRWVNSYGPQN